MSRLAFIFPGQGAQYTGMAQEFYETFEECRDVFSRASAAAGFSVEKLCFEEGQPINQTKYTQPALLTASCAILRAVESAGIHADMTAGLSLGEYCSLAASGAVNFEDAVRLVCKRGAYMEDAVPDGSGAMMAIISRHPVPVEEVCEQTPGVVSVANYNYPGQRVITGEKKAVEIAAERLIELGAQRAVMLRVSGPFHSELLAGAEKKLEAKLRRTDIAVPEIPFVSNVTAEAESDPERLRQLLARQVCSPVLWEQSVAYMKAQGIDTFVEIGPGQTLSRFIQKTDRTLRVFHVEIPEDLEILKRELASETVMRGSLQNSEKKDGKIAC